MPLTKIDTTKPTIDVFPAQTFNALVDAARRRQLSDTLFGGRASRHVLPDAFFWKNSDASAAPQGAIVRFTGAEAMRDRVVATGAKPDATLRPFYGVSLEPVAAGEVGRCTATSAARLYYLTSDGTPAFGEVWGIESGQWYARKNRPGFYILGDPNGSGVDAQALAAPLDAGRLLGKTDAATSKGSSGTVSVWAGGAGSEADTTLNVTATNKFADIAAGKWVWIESNGHAFYYTAAEC